MSHRLDNKQARRAERRRQAEQARHAQDRQRWMRRAGYGAVGLIAATLVTIAVALGGGGGTPAHDMAGSSGSTARVGTLAPQFALTDVVSGKQVTRSSLAGRKTLLFFSEGVGCQACMVQTAELQRTPALSRAGVALVSVTTDAPGDLAQAARQYGIRTPMLADATTQMSSAYGMLGHGGMGHPTQDGHAFILLDGTGRVLWHQAYQEMYVKPSRLLADMGLKA